MSEARLAEFAYALIVVSIVALAVRIWLKGDYAFSAAVGIVFALGVAFMWPRK